MAKSKITKLGDPSNPYTKKKVSAEQARASARATGNDKPRQKMPAPLAKKAARRKEVTGPLGRARKAVLDKRIKDAGA